MNVEIAQRLALRRRNAGLSQEALAEKLGVSRQAVSKWERSESSPDTDNLIALAQLYNLSLDDLLYAEVPPANEPMPEKADTKEPESTDPEPSVSEFESYSTDDIPVEEVEVEVETEPVEDTNNSHSTASGFNYDKEDRGKVHIGFDGIHVEDGGDSVHVSWAEGVHVVDHAGEEVHVDWDGVRINSKQGPRPDQVFKHDRHHRDRYGYYGQGPLTPFARNWLRFPFWALVIIAYLLAGIIQGFWLPGLCFFLTIPVYYALGPAIEHKRIAPFLGVLYPILTIGWFCWMAFVENQPHPAWAIFLTIPIVEVCIVAFSKWWRHRKR